MAARPRVARRVLAGLNKGEALHALKRAVAFHRSGEIRDQSFEAQSNRASGLNLVTTAITVWNTVYLGRASRPCALRVWTYPTSCWRTCHRCRGSTSG